MWTLLGLLGALALGFAFGYQYGIATAMLRMQNVIEQLQEIEKLFNEWNEDKL